MIFKLNDCEAKLVFEHRGYEMFERALGMVPTTRAFIYLNRNVFSAFRGTAECSAKDTPTKEKGRKVALARAIKDFPRDTRKMIWDLYLKRPRYA